MSRHAVLLLAVMSVLMLWVAGPALAQMEGDPAPSPNWGVGVGIPYGVIGVNVEAGDQTRLSAGVGFSTEFSWNIGAKHYFSEPVVGRGSASISVYYGTNALFTGGRLDDQTETGFSAGLGWTSGHFDIGAIYCNIGDIPAGYTQKGGNVKFYIGYRF